MITDLKDQAVRRSDHVQEPAPFTDPEQGHGSEQGHDTEAIEAAVIMEYKKIIAGRIARAKELHAQGRSQRCTDCYADGRDDVIRIIEGA